MLQEHYREDSVPPPLSFSRPAGGAGPSFNIRPVSNQLGDGDNYLSTKVFQSVNYRQPYEDIMGSEDRVETSLNVNADLRSLIIQQHRQMNSRIDLLTQRLESRRKPRHEKESDSETENEDHIPGGRF